MKRKFALFLALTLTVVLTACSGTSAPDSQSTGVPTPADGSDPSQASESAGAAKEKIGALLLTDNDYNNQMGVGIKKAANENGYDFMSVVTNFDPELELSGLETLYASGVKSFYTISIGPEVLAEELKKYADLGVLCHNASEGFNATVVEDNATICSSFSESVKAFMNDKGMETAEIAAFWIPGTMSNNSGVGYEAYTMLPGAVKDTFGDSVKIVTDLESEDASVETAANLTETVLNTYPDTRVFFYYNNDMAIAGANTIAAAVADCSDYYVFSSEANDEVIRLIGIDSSPLRGCTMSDIEGFGYDAGLQLINWIENGEMTNIAPQKILIDERNVSGFSD